MADTESDQKTKTPEGAKTVPPKKSGSNNKVLIIVLVVVLVLFILPGIMFAIFVTWLSSGDNAENFTEQIVERATGSEIDIDREGGTFTIETEDGDSTFSFGSTEVPDNFPVNDVPLYENMNIVSAAESSNAQGDFWSINGTSDTDRQSVLSSIEGSYSDWTRTSRSSLDGYTLVNYEKESYNVTISVISSDDGQVQIGYNVQRNSSEQ